MEIHLIVALASGGQLDIARAPAFDLYTATCLLLNVLDVGTPGSHDVSTQVKARDRLKRDGNSLLRPFSLTKQAHCLVIAITGPAYRTTHSAILISFNSVLLPSSEASLVDQLRQLLIDEFVDLGDRAVKAILRRACYVKV
jgi:hypothetical protein